jgi:hypothetical protein
LCARRAKLQTLWTELEQKQLQRRARNRRALDDRTLARLNGKTFGRKKVVLEQPVPEHQDRITQYHGEIAMLNAALHGLASPQEFGAAINQARRGTHMALYRGEVALYRRGLERQYVALCTWLPPGTAEAPGADSKLAKMPVGWRVRAAGAFESELLRSDPPEEPELTEFLPAHGSERVLVRELRQRILGLSQRDIIFAQNSIVRSEDRFEVSLRGEMLQALYEESHGAVSHAEMLAALKRIPTRHRFRVPKDMAKEYVTDVIQDCFEQIGQKLMAFKYGASAAVAFPATRPSRDINRRRHKGRGKAEASQSSAAK